MKCEVLAVVVLVLLWIDGGFAIQCYQCDSETNPDCTENFDHSNYDILTVHSTDCDLDAANYCIKTTGVWGGVVGTTRFCSSRDMGNQCQYINYPDHDRVYRACIYTCGRNHCNAAPHSVHISVATMLLALVCSLLSRYIS